jgi:hypothetical protein
LGSLAEKSGAANMGACDGICIYGFVFGAIDSEDCSFLLKKFGSNES